VIDLRPHQGRLAGRPRVVGKSGKERKVQMAGTRPTRTFAMVALLSTLALAAAACSNGSSTTAGAPSGGSAASNAPAHLNVELDWVPNPDHVGLYYAKEKGDFAAANLSVEFRQPSNAADPIKLVGLNKVDLAISYQPEMFYGQQSGLPVVAVATVVPVPLNSLIVAPGETASSLADMKGRSIGVTGIPSDDAFFETMLKTAGLASGDVTKVNVGFSLVPSILSNKVDAIIGGYRNVEAIQIAQESGKTPTVFPADQLGVPTYAELVLVANKDRLSSDPAYADSVRRFVATLVKGTNDAIADPTGATAIMKKDTQYKPAFLDQSVPFTLTLLTPASGTKTGCIDVANWQSYGDWMKSSGLITSTPDASAVATDDYLPYAC
jgi:putative hydroxymethylpyrimidine transport system substrate-binding protein